MNDGLPLAAAVLPVATLVAGGVSLWPTRARVAGVWAVVCGVGTLAALTAWGTGHPHVGAVALTASLMLPGALALLTYPSPRGWHGVDFCAYVVVLGAGVIATTRPDWSVLSTMGLMSLLGLFGHLWWRFEAADEDDRLAVLWVSLVSVTSGLVTGQLVFLTTTRVALVVGSVLIATVGPGLAVGVLRPRLVDVRGLIVSVVVVVIVVSVYLSLFIGAVSVLDLAGQHEPSVGVLAAIGALAATTFHPLRVMLRGVIDELLFGDRPDPLDAAARVVDRIGDDPVLALRAIREALVLPYASVWSGGVELASSGTAVTHLRRLALQLGSDDLGEIVVGLRQGDLSLSAGDEHVLRIVAPLLAQTLRARALAADLQTSRGQAIAAIEEERRRLRRDLHDGLGPTLSGIAFTADAARNTLRDQPDSADELLRGLRADAVTAVGEIRRLVYDMRPPALDELGLVPALRQRAASMRTDDGRSMRVSVEVPDALPELPAAVETAAYRIATEALANAARHSGADEADLCIGVDDGRLSVAVRDPGLHGQPWTPGVGISSMRERAAEVGGAVTVLGGEQGFAVHALLPLA
ncbi:MAG TPA: histidine kinase [Nocardioides sp.]|uniref:sensor histidine kinase n=1 Tax=Nocardioides sp. TaxID=35761 RepID=UPI002E2EE872|nr:histidine kinase [Nocardioides sp.]HEX3931996.1 histidine kinase [Nocardioides sp.]